jgi:hypothetical protein
MAFPRPDNEKQDKIRRESERQFLHKMVGFFIGALLLTTALYVGLEETKKKGSTPSALTLNAKETQQSVGFQAVVTPPIADLEKRVHRLDAEVRKIKETGVIMETDPESLRVTQELQEATLALLKAKYGNHASYRVQLDLEFQPSIPDYDIKGKDGTLVIEMAPIDLLPVSVFNFLEMARTHKSGAFHRNAGHVLQATAKSDVTRSLPFQEYSDKFPHQRGTTGYAGRPSGPGFYISIQDNTKNHGPGSQQKKNPYEADSLFGRVVDGMDDVVPRIHSTPERSWLSAENQINILRMHILVPDGKGGYQEWRE